MSDEEKKKGDYEKPESHEMGGDELEGVAGGTEGEGGATACGTGSSAAKTCRSGSHAGTTCNTGDAAGQVCGYGSSGR